jgi:hypothetical protein
MSEGKLNPFECSYRLERSAQMVQGEKGIELKAVFVVAVTEPKKRKPSLNLVGDTPEEAFESVADWVRLGSPDSAAIKAGAAS